MREKLVSIIVPVYNVEAYLEKCVSSIVLQSYKNIEMILVDDGSTDSSGAICNRFAAEDFRVRVIHQANGGLVAARKAGIRAAAGEYVGFVDGDDFVDEKMYEELVCTIEEFQADFVHSGYLKDSGQRCSAKYKRKYIPDCGKSREKILKELVFDPSNEQSIAPSIWSKLFRREFLLKIYGQVPDSLSYGEDLVCLCGCILECRSFGILSGAYYHYVKREDSICGEKRIENIQRETELYKALKELCIKYRVYPGLKEGVEHYYLRNMMGCVSRLTGVPCPVYRWPAGDELEGKRILLYGAGEVGHDYYLQLCADARCSVAAVVDREAGRAEFEHMGVIGPDRIDTVHYDVIVIAVLHEDTAAAIAEELVEKGIGREKILWRRPKLVV